MAVFDESGIRYEILDTVNNKYSPGVDILWGSKEVTFRIRKLDNRTQTENVYNDFKIENNYYYQPKTFEGYLYFRAIATDRTVISKWELNFNKNDMERFLISPINAPDTSGVIKVACQKHILGATITVEASAKGYISDNYSITVSKDSIFYYLRFNARSDSAIAFNVGILDPVNLRLMPKTGFIVHQTPVESPWGVEQKRFYTGAEGDTLIMIPTEHKGQIAKFSTDLKGYKCYYSEAITWGGQKDQITLIPQPTAVRGVLTSNVNRILTGIVTGVGIWIAVDANRQLGKSYDMYEDLSYGLSSYDQAWSDVEKWQNRRKTGVVITSVASSWLISSYVVPYIWSLCNRK